MPPSHSIEHVKQSFNADWSKQYRLGDETVVRNSDTFRHYGGILKDLTTFLPAPIDVLDAGCGSGRYFHCLRNVRRLVGIDVSPDMIEQAKHPVQAEQIQAATVELYCGEVLTTAFPQGSFDLIYSIGVYGEYSPLDAALLDRFAYLLKPNGALFITAVDSGSRVSFPETGHASLTRHLSRKAFPFLPDGLKASINRRLSPNYLRKHELEALLRRSPFSEFSISSYRHMSGWQGTHWDCFARQQRLDEEHGLSWNYRT